MRKIERFREQCLSSRQEITFLDHGAGSSEHHEHPHIRTVCKTVGAICQGASLPYFWSFLLFKLIREFKPVICMELGTCLGVSTSFQAAALLLNHHGRIITLEGAESLASLSQSHFQTLGLNNIQIVVGNFQDTLAQTLREQEPVDFVFIDGHHEETATLTHFQQLLSCLQDTSLVVLDDISWSEGMKKAWRAIASDAEVKYSIDTGRMGICLLDKKIVAKHHVRIPLSPDEGK
ncbi:MAG: class I SAM-dependent methyltransferase [Planctomycetota bacterium]